MSKKALKKWTDAKNRVSELSVEVAPICDVVEVVKTLGPISLSDICELLREREFEDNIRKEFWNSVAEGRISLDKDYRGN